MKPQNKFFTRSGWLTTYAMSCGYHHETVTECGNVHIIFKANNIGLNTFDIISYINNVRQSWDVIESVQNARKTYASACKSYTNKGPRRRFERAEDVSRFVYA